MCDAVSERGKGWRGWIELPKADVPRPIGGWVDCSWPVSKDMPRVALFPEPTIRLVKSLPVDPINVTEIGMVVHIGTHVDAPRHFFMDGPAFDEIPFDRLSGPGVVWRFDKQEHDLIEVADLERATPAMRPGDIVAIDTGFAARFGTSAYERHPSLSHDAAKWLVAKKAKLVACDFGTPDLPLHRRGKDFNWPVHLELLSHGVLICEHLAGHTALAGRRVEFVISALNIRSSDGAPARIMAREIAD
jgi:kynurenine formamidase